MKILLHFATILVIICNVASYRQLSFLRALGGQENGVSTLNFPSYSDQCEGNKFRECISCSEAKLCLPNGRPIAKINCTSYSPSTPFCNPEDGLCTSSQPSGCGESQENLFQCPPQDGVYPDPDDCTKFHFCTKNKDTTVNCPKNNVYDHVQGTCKLRRWITDCIKFNCLNKEGDYILYPKDDKIWAICAGGNAYIMGRCEDWEIFDIDKKKCTRVCRIVENQPIKNVCNSYIRCAEIGNGKLEPVTFPCPPGQGFDIETKKCSAKISCTINSGGNEEEEEEKEKEEEEEENKEEEEKEEILGRFFRIINTSGNNNVNNNIENGNDTINGDLVNGNDNLNNINAGNINSGNHHRTVLRIINNSGNNNNGNKIENGDDNVEGTLINGNNNGNNVNSDNIETGNEKVSRIVNSSGNSNRNQTIVNGNDSTNGTVINGNNNNNNINKSVNTATGNIHGDDKNPTPSSSSSSSSTTEKSNELDQDNSKGKL